MRGNQLSLAATTAVVMVLVTGAQAEPSKYLCIVEGAGGLHYDNQNQSWTPQAFGTGGKYVLRRLNNDDWTKEDYRVLLQLTPKANWAFFESGKNLLLATCVDDPDGVGAPFICEPVVYYASFDKDSRRFEMFLHGGYIRQGFWEQFRREHPDIYKWQLSEGRASDPSRPEDLFVAIGKCSPS
jgi:hypothetical protein